MLSLLTNFLLLIVTSFISVFITAVGVSMFADVFQEVHMTVELPAILEIFFVTCIGYLVMVPGLLFYFTASSVAWWRGVRNLRAYLLVSVVTAILNIEGLYVFDAWYKESITLTGIAMTIAYTLMTLLHTSLLKKMKF